MYRMVMHGELHYHGRVSTHSSVEEQCILFVLNIYSSICPGASVSTACQPGLTHHCETSANGYETHLPGVDRPVSMTSETAHPDIKMQRGHTHPHIKAPLSADNHSKPLSHSRLTLDSQLTVQFYY